MRRSSSKLLDTTTPKLRLRVKTVDNEEEEEPEYPVVDEASLRKENRKLRKALRLAVASMEQLKNDTSAPDDADETANTMQRELGRWKRKHKVMEKHLGEATKMSKQFAEEIQALRTEAVAFREYENKASKEIEKLSDNLLITTDEIEHKTRTLAGAMTDIQNLKAQIAKKEEIHVQVEKLKSDLKQVHTEYGKLKQKQAEQQAATVNRKPDTVTDPQLVQKYEDAAGQVKQLQQSLTDTQSRLANREAKVAKLKAKNENLEKERVLLREELTSLARARKPHFIATVTSDGELEAGEESEEGVVPPPRPYVSTSPVEEEEEQPSNTRRKSSSRGALNSKRQKARAAKKLCQPLTTSSSRTSESKKILKMEKELGQIREQLIYSEERRKGDMERQLQIMRGKEEESEYIWQKYVEAIKSPAAAAASLSARRSRRNTPRR